MPANAFIRDGRGIAEVFVTHPADAVFDYVADLRHMPAWWSEHQTYGRLLGKGGPGTLYAWAMQRGPIPFAPPFGGLTVVTVHERPMRFGYRIVSPGLLTRMTYKFTSVSAGTRVSLESRSAAYRVRFFARNFPEHIAPALDKLAAILAATPHRAEGSSPTSR
jgi:uncharacterized protein YndB with AHSA1/START domain